MLFYWNIVKISFLIGLKQGIKNTDTLLTTLFENFFKEKAK